MLDGIIALGSSKKYTDEQLKKYQTGNVTVEKGTTDIEYLILTAQKGTPNESKITFSKEELRGLGIKSITKNEDGDTIVTLTDNTTQNIGQWNGKNATIETVDDTDNKYTLKISYYDKDNKLVTFVTPNLKANKGKVNLKTNTKYKTILEYVETDENGVDSVKWTSDNIHGNVQEIKPNENNNSNSFKVDIDTYDEEGNKTTVTSDELMAEKYDINPKSTNNKYDYRLEIEKTKNDGTKETKITSNLKGNELWSGRDLIGDEIVFEVVADDDKSYSRVNDLYLNTDTNDIYRRTDKNNVNNLWEKVGNIQGLEGNDAYEVAVKEGFQGTRSEWLKSLMGESLGSQIVWTKPSIRDEGTLLKVWYYYKIDNAKYGKGSAWLNRYNIPSDKDYEPNTYSFYNGINYLTFTSTISTIPSSTQKYLYSFYALYDEQNSKCIVHMVNKTTEEDTVLGDWINVTKSATKPESSELVTTDGDIIQYGTWVQTIYLGNSKDSAYDCTITTGADVSGFITQETFDNVVGTDNLKTDNQKVKSAINEIFDMIKANKNTVLETDNKALFEAVNELYKKKYMDCYELKDEDLLTHCLSSQYRTLSCNFIYAENCTNVPNDNNGYGYAMLIVSQDTHYRQVIFFDPSNGKISTNNIGANATNTDFGNWSGWDSPSNHGVPIGSIQAYYGRAMGLSIPNGWVLCNGATITDTESPLYGKTLPDLRNRVLAMASSEGVIGTNVGSNTIKLNRNQLPNAVLETSGTLNYTPQGTISINSNGSHNHSIMYPDNTTGNPNGATDTSSSSETKRRYWRYPSSGYTGNAGSHSHSATFTGQSRTLVLSTSGNLNGAVTQQNIDNRQATMYVDYIMKIR